jgi:CRISPR-associated endonuclease/helicase Cas3
MNQPAYAHSLPGQPPDKWQPLDEHLKSVAEMARDFAAEFDSGDWAYLAGLWHDLGKYSEEFQAYLRSENNVPLGELASFYKSHVEHAFVGAISAAQVIKEHFPFCMLIACHHTGLQDAVSMMNGLRAKRISQRELFKRAIANANPDLLNGYEPIYPGFVCDKTIPTVELLWRREFWLRMLFSALKDADCLDSAGKAQPTYDSILTLRTHLDAYIESIANKAREGGYSPVNRQRESILIRCRQVASLPRGVFSLTVPTGGGKTLSGMSFALYHAVYNKMSRVLVILPYTSIIEQNARVYEKALGADNVIQHHSSLDPVKETERNKLASENWDAPVVVTTNVQFFESLFAARTSTCRKLHNIAKSVIILDEAQCLPSGFLYPILDVLRQLVAHYGCSLVISTATQPALGQRQNLVLGFKEVREIIADPNALARNLSRVQVEWPKRDDQPTTYEAIRDRILREDMQRVMVITHRRADAAEMARLLPSEARFHLSALMCPAHRRVVLEAVRQTLKAPNAMCRLTTTQLVEAGVDVDFPIVFRAMGGLDSLTQAAGRCNREGCLDKGRLIVYRAPSLPPPGIPRRGLDVTVGMLDTKNTAAFPRTEEGAPDIFAPTVFDAYFRQLYAGLPLDVRNVMPLREEYKFASVAKAVELIEEGKTWSLVVPYGEAPDLLHQLRKKDRMMLEDHRLLQAYTVQVYNHDWEKLKNAIDEPIHDAIYSLTKPYEHLYSQEFGLQIDGDIMADPSELISDS